MLEDLVAVLLFCRTTSVLERTEFPDNSIARLGPSSTVFELIAFSRLTYPTRGTAKDESVGLVVDSLRRAVENSTRSLVQQQAAIKMKLFDSPSSDK